MATETRISIAAPEVHLWEGTKLDPASAEKASQVLQENHEKHHIFFNLAGLHVRTWGACVMVVLTSSRITLSITFSHFLHWVQILRHLKRHIRTTLTTRYRQTLSGKVAVWMSVTPSNSRSVWVSVRGTSTSLSSSQMKSRIKASSLQ